MRIRCALGATLFVRMLVESCGLAVSATVSTSARGVAAPADRIAQTEVPTVLVTGSSGRVGQLVAKKLLKSSPTWKVRATTRDVAKAKQLFVQELQECGDRLEIVRCDLSSERDIAKVAEGASAVIWCATGFTQPKDIFDRFLGIAKLILDRDNVIDFKGVQILSKSIQCRGDWPGPQFVLLSSAAVTRPQWPAEVKSAFKEAADIPIVKLNPFNILNLKLKGEEALRRSDLSYAVVRACGLNDSQPKGRFVLSKGDLATGRICRSDIADVLVECLQNAAACSKTFEVFSVPGLQPLPLSEVLQNVSPDSSAAPSLSEMQAAYDILRQLRPQ